MKEKQNQTRSRKYSNISYEVLFFLFQKRLKLIGLIINSGFSTNQAAKKVRVNPETAKVILRNFRTNGHIFQRKSEKIDIKQENI